MSDLADKIEKTVDFFAERLKAKLIDVAILKGKGDWEQFSAEQLFFRLLEEVAELYEAMTWYRESAPEKPKGLPEHVLGEAIDVAALAMFIADNVSKRERE